MDHNFADCSCWSCYWYIFICLSKIAVAFARALSKTLTKVSRCYLVCWGIMLTLSLAWPILTTGNSIPLTWTPEIRQKITHIHHESGHQSWNDFVADEDWQNSTRVTEYFSAVLLEFSSQVVIVLHDFLSQLSAHLRSEDSQVGQWGGGLYWVDSIGEHVCGWVVFQVFDDSGVVASDEANIGAQTLASSAEK